MKKILIAAKNMNIGGVEKSLLSLLDTISPEEYQVDLLLLENYGGFMDLIPKWVNVIFLKEYGAIKAEVNAPPHSVILRYLKEKRWGRGFRLAWGYGRTRLTGNWAHYYKAVFRNVQKLPGHYDAAISYSSIISYLTWYVCCHVNADIKVGWIHFDVSKLSLNHRLIEQLHGQMEKIYVVSQESLDAFSRAYPDLREKCELRYNVVNSAAIRRLAYEPVEDLSKRNTLTIMTLGRLSPEKGQDIIPDVAFRLREQGLAFRWYLIGDGPLMHPLAKRIEQLRMEDRIILLGTKANPYPYLKQADIYVQTSVHEGYCISLAEARVFDLPIVSTDFAGAREQLEGRANSVIAPRDAAALTEGILSLVKQIKI